MTKQQQLQRYRYHWLLGLRSSSVQRERNLLESIQSWTPQKVAEIRHQQRQIKTNMAVIRFIYWVFNLRFYAEHYYQLCAYDWLSEKTTKELDMGFISDMKNKFTEAKNSLNDFFSGHNSMAAPVPSDTSSEVNHDLSNFGSLILRKNSNHDSTSSSASTPREDVQEAERPIDMPKTELRVTSSMVYNLHILGINVEIGQPVLFKDIYKTYLQKALELHPDKNSSPNAHAMFISVLSAYESLKTIFNQTSESSDPSPCIWKKLDELERDFEEIRSSWSEIRTACEENIRGYQKFNQILREGLSELAKNKIQQDSFQQRLDEQEQQLKEMEIEIRELVQQNRGTDHGASIQYHNPLPSPRSELGRFFRHPPSGLHFFGADVPHHFLYRVAQNETMHHSKKPVLMICDRTL